MKEQEMKHSDEVSRGGEAERQTRSDPAKHAGTTAGSPTSVAQPHVALNVDGDVDNDDCAVLESMDSFVGCVEGVEVQRVFEESLDRDDYAHSLLLFHNQHPNLFTSVEQEPAKVPAMEQKLEPKKGRNSTAAVPSASLAHTNIADIDILNLCGSDDDNMAEQFHVSSPFNPNESPNPNSTHSIARLSLGKESSSSDSETSFHSAVQDSRSSSEKNTDPSATQCAICFDEQVTFARLPCCGHAEATSTCKICTACLLLLTDSTSDGSSRVGRCPRCRSWIVISTPSIGSPMPSPSASVTSSILDNLEIRAVTSAGKCTICNQVKDHLVDSEAAVCDACFLGRRRPLLYECQQCHRIQGIPHPMYRYQAQPDVFGNVTWACHGPCQAFTYWRIGLSQLTSIPVGDAPQGWGDDYLMRARNRVQAARQHLRSPVLDSNVPQAQDDNSGCVIL